MFTQQHFKRIAEVFKATKPPTISDVNLPDSDWGFLVNKMADVFEQDNSHFDRERFIRRCGMQKNVER